MKPNITSKLKLSKIRKLEMKAWLNQYKLRTDIELVKLNN